jgi:glycopeptide antibiotics resistance protein
MGDLSPGGIRIRRERVRRWAWAGWLLLAAFIVVGSAGRWAPYSPGVWAPTLINPSDVARNVALYVPFGVLGMLALDRANARGTLRVAAIAFLFSLANEALQLYTADRVASLTDIASAGVGTMAGASMVAWLVRPK